MEFSTWWTRRGTVRRLGAGFPRVCPTARRRPRKLACAVALAASAVMGCYAYHSATPLHLDPVGPLAGYPRTLVVGVREPEIKLDPPIVQGEEGEPWTSLGKLSLAISLIRSLRASGLYLKVDFEKQLKCSPDLVVEVEENPRLQSCDGDAVMALIYLGIVPVWYSCDEGHYFSLVGDKREHFAFPWHETQMFGWFMPIFDLFPGWTQKPPPRSQHDDAFRAFLLSHASVLLPARKGKARAPCPAR